jgi:hypothetical protein
MSQLKAAAIALAGVVVGITLWQWLSEDPQPAPVRVEVAKEHVIAPPSAKAADTDMAVVNPLGHPIAAPAKLAPAAKTLGRQLLEAKDIKAFVIEALKHPENGGAFYATIALDRCYEGILVMKAAADATIKKIVAAESTIGPERIAAINGALTRCAGFPEGEIFELRSEAFKHAVDGTDPLYTTEENLRDLSPGSPELKTVFDSGFWGVISQRTIPLYLMRSAPDDRASDVTLRFKGKIYPDGSADQLVLIVATRLGTCVDGDYCALDFEMETQCRRLGQCYATREEFVRSVLLGENAAAYDKAVQIAAEIRSAIARGSRAELAHVHHEGVDPGGAVHGPILDGTL